MKARQSASNKLGVFFRSRNIFSTAELLRLYVGFICLCNEYCSHAWGNSPFTCLLDREVSKALHHVSDMCFDLIPCFYLRFSDLPHCPFIEFIMVVVQLNYGPSNPLLFPDPAALVKRPSQISLVGYCLTNAFHSIENHFSPPPPSLKLPTQSVFPNSIKESLFNP